MKKLVFALLLGAIALPGCAPELDERPPLPGAFRMIGWFYADAVVHDTNPGEDPEEVYNGPIAYRVTHEDVVGGHTYFGVLCGPTDYLLNCNPKPVDDLPFGPEYPIRTTITGCANDRAAQFRVITAVDGDGYQRDWDITNVSDTAPGTNAIDLTPPKLGRPFKEIAQLRGMN